jgi:hypothetical protein
VSRWLTVALIVLGAVVLWATIDRLADIFGGDDTEALIRAETAEARAADLQGLLDSLEASRATLAREDSLREAELADSVAVYRARAQASRQREAAARARAAATATDVMARLDSVGQLEFQAHLDDDAEIEAATASQIADLQAEIVGLQLSRRSMEELYRAAVAASDTKSEIIEQQRIALMAKDDVIRSRGRQNTLLKIGGAALVGWGLYDRLAGRRARGSA